MRVLVFILPMQEEISEQILQSVEYYTHGEIEKSEERK